MKCFVCEKEFCLIEALIVHLKVYHSLSSYSTYQCCEDSGSQLFSNVNTFKHLKQLCIKWKVKLGIQIKFEKNLLSWKNTTINNFGSLNIKYESEIYNLNEDPSSSSNMDSSAIVDVEKIMKLSFQGRTVLDFFKNNLKLNDGLRTVTVDVVINYLIQNDVRMTVNLAQKIAEDIIKIFQTESLEYYYLKQSGRKPQGKLYDKYFNTIRKHNGVFKKRPYSYKTTNNKRVLSLGPPEDNINNNIEAIITDNCSWAEIESHWAATKNYRMNEIFNLNSTSDIISKWPQYKKPLGFKLIDIDFKHLYPKAESLHINFKNFCSKIDYIFEDRIKDPASKVLFQTMVKMENLSEIF